MASTGFMMRMSSPAVSCSGRYFFTFSMISASWPRFSSSQNTAGEPVARARLTASFTQSRMGTSLAWHMRKMSPGSTGCSRSVVPAASTTRMVPSAGAMKVLSWEPYSSAFWAIRPTLEHAAHGGRVELAVLLGSPR